MAENSEAFMCDYLRDLDWILDLLTTYTHHSKLQVITALLLISTLCKSSQHPLTLFQHAVFSTASNSGDSSVPRVHVVNVRPIARI
jgi:hypothetical protein